MAFLETPRFPDDLSYDFGAENKWRNERVEMNSGHEAVNIRWSQPLLRFDAAYAARFPIKLEALKAFWHTTRGSAHRFRIKDHTDYQVPDHNGSGVLVQLTATTWQLYKRYTSGASTFDRKIQKPVSGTVVVTGGTVASIDYTTGIVTMTSGTPTSWVGQFDVPARFGEDSFTYQIVNRSGVLHVIDCSPITIVEVRL